jgi:hypothetical protein
MPASRSTDVHELEIATDALVTALDNMDDAEKRRDADVLVAAVPCCVEVAGLLAALAGRLGALALTMAGEPSGATEEMMTDIAADLSTMRSLLHRVTLVAAPTLADLRRLPSVAIRPR